MKNKVVSRMLSLALATTLAVSSVPMNYYSVSTARAAAAERAVVYEDGIFDEWAQDEATVKGNGAVCAVEDGWLHLKADPANGNNPGTNPAMFVNPNTFHFDEAGYFSFTMKTTNANTGTTDSDRFGIYLGYNTEKNGMFVGYDNGGWFWQKYTNGNGAYYSGGRTAAPKPGTEVDVRIDWTADHKMSLTLDGKAVFTNEDFSGITGTLADSIAIKCGAWQGNVTNVFLKNIHYQGQAEAASYAVTGTVKDTDGKAIAGAEVKLGAETAVTDAAGAYSFTGIYDGTYTLVVTKDGYNTQTSKVVVDGADAEAAAIVLTAREAAEERVLSTEAMDVYVSDSFPSVFRYEMKGDLAGKTFYGQTKEINTVKINGTAVELSKDDVTVEFTDNKAVYTMTVKGANIDAVVTAELVAEKNTLAFNITGIQNNLEDKVGGSPIQTIEIPNHSLVSVRTSQKGANLKGAAMSSSTTISGDEYVELSAGTKLDNKDYMYAFVSNDELSAGLWSNSEHEGRTVYGSVTGGSHNTRIYATSEAADGEVSVGLASAPWYYHRVVQSATKVDENGKTYTIPYMVKETEMPKTKIIITGDQNDDKEVNWQDGAVAFRSIMNNPFKSEEVPELVAYRIAMNFGGHAQNPFLTTLDNVKRVAMHTDGLGQSVLLKGYGSEGHDSGHPDYADIGERIGGAEDMNFLMTNGAKYGAKFGIHVNAGEMYPEAKAFSDMLVRRDGAGNLRYGWNWIDQGVGIDSIYDLGEGLREKRFDELEEKVGQNLDFVYVDIWGNNTGSDRDDSWQTRKLSKEINDNGWRMANEWGAANEYDSTFQHWATDLTYGGKDMKGENSEVMRFLRNHQKDSWVGDYPSYGGAANMPLLGGYNMKDFEGWQGRNDYDTYITNLYTHDVTTKFIQHYKVVKWVDGETVNGWTPEMEITLKDDDGATLVLKRGSNNPNDAAYRERTMTLDGKVIATGAPSKGDRSNADIQNGRNKGTEKYLLPWIWNSETGEKTASEDEKLYHWNTQGGTSTWELPDSWAGLENVKVYKLTDLGKTEEKTVAVVDGKITLEAESEIPYVVCKGERGNLDITWSEGMHIVDAGFNSGNFDAWTKTGAGTAVIAKSQYSNPMMKLDGEIAMTQTLTDLTPGQQYAVLVGVDNRSNAKASVTVKVDGKEVASNYTTKSIAKNYVKAYTHSNSSATVGGSSYFQNMYVFFTAPANGEVTLTLSRAAGEGSTYFDDVRITENESDNVTTNDKGEIVKFAQDFETNVQGLYPFVVGGIEGVEDNRTHLSELHAPYTQAGWDVKKMDDVLDGKWSVKVNGLVGSNNLVYQTIPQNFRFEPGVTYKVSFDYQSGSDDIYGVIVGDGEFVRGQGAVTKLKKALGTDAHYTQMITGAEDGQTWFGIYSTNIAPDYQGASGSAQAFGGYKDIVLDNLVIERVTVDKTILSDLKAEVAKTYNKSEYTKASWAALTEALAAADKVLAMENPTEAEIMEAYEGIMGAVAGLVKIDPEAARDLPLEGMTATTGSQQSSSGIEGPASNVIDNDASTFWHTTWAGTPIENHWINIHLAEPTTVGGVRILPRPSGTNGVIQKAEIWVKTAGSAEYVKVADGTFGSGWKKVTFDEVENVTDVKVQPTSTSGDVANKFSSAAEIRIMGAEEVEVPEEKNTYRVTVTGGTITGGTTVGDYEYNTKLTVTADGTTDGQKFLGWEVNGNVLSTEETYTFFVGSDLTVRALYGAEALEVEAQAYLQDVTVTKREDGKSDIRYLAQLVVPEGAKLEDAGLVWRNKDNTENLVIGGESVKVTRISKISNTYQFSVTIKGVPSGNTVPGRIFAVIDGEEIYSDNIGKGVVK